LSQDLGKLFPLVAEANAIAKNNKRPITFTIKMEKNKSITSNPSDERTELWVLVDNNEEKYHYQWSKDKFLNRFDMMRN
jgi:hypothetical protein